MTLKVLAAIDSLVTAVRHLADAEDRRARAEEIMVVELDRIREEMRIQREINRK